MGTIRRQRNNTSNSLKCRKDIYHIKNLTTNEKSLEKQANIENKDL